MRGLLAAPALVIGAILLLGIAFPVAAERPKKAFLTGDYKGKAEDGGTVSFKITARGQMVNFRASHKLRCNRKDPAPDVLISATVTAPGRIPRDGARFRYQGPGGSPPGMVTITAKRAAGFRGMQGSYYMDEVAPPPEEGNPSPPLCETAGRRERGVGYVEFALRPK